MYKSIKPDFYTEPNRFKIYNKRNRSPLARLKAVCLDFEIEKTKYVNCLYNCTKLNHIIPMGIYYSFALCQPCIH